VHARGAYIRDLAESRTQNISALREAKTSKYDKPADFSPETPIPRYFAGISSRKLITSAAIAALIVFGQSGANKGE
jgi:hypothetical protein